MMKPIVTVKIGGRAAADNDTLLTFLRELATLRGEYQFILVHGGGADVSEVTKLYGYEPVFEDGVRKTSDVEMPIVDMVLAGKVNKYLVRSCHSVGIDAVGCSGADGATLIGESVAHSRTGTVTSASARLPIALLNGDWTPVIAPVSMEPDGSPLNINADEAALEIAVSIPAESLIFLSDIPGILKDGLVIQRIDAAGIEKEISSGVITGGMIPKVRSSLSALGRGVQRITIGQYENDGDLAALMNGISGTKIMK